MTVRNYYVCKVGTYVEKEMPTFNDKVICADFGKSQNLFLHHLKVYCVLK